MGFQHSIAGGQGNLIATSVQSPNFVHGVSGWRIAKDGSAEFHDIEIPAGSGGATIYFASTAPASPNVGDLWYDTADDLKLSQWNGTTWTAYQFGTDAIAGNSITTALIAAGAVGTTQVAANAITSALIASGAVGNSQLASGAVGTSNIQSGAVGTSEIAAGAVTATQIAAAAGIVGTQLASGTITNTELAGSVTARSIGGITTTIASSAPASPVAGDIWIDSANGYQLQQYSGSAWNALTWTATDIIAAGSISASLITANTITASQIASGTITAAQIATGTITATLLAAGIVVAGIVNGTTISGATIVADGTAGQILVYSGSPTSGNLIGAWSGAAGSDSNSNAFIAGLQVGANGGNQILAQPNVNQQFNITTTIAGIFEAMFQYTTTDANEMMPSMMGSVLLGTGTATKMSSIFHSPFGTEGAAIVLESQNDAGTDTPVITLGTVTMPSGAMVFTPVMTLTPYAMVLYSSASAQTVKTYTSSTTWTAPSGVTSVKAECWGAGGGGGDTSTTNTNFSGGGGGGGEYAAESSDTVVPGDVYTITVGTGGAGATGDTGANGSAGGNSSFSGTSATTVTAHGGSGGNGCTSSADGTGGAVGTGSTNNTHYNCCAGASGGTFDAGQWGGGGGSSAGVSSAGNAGGSATPQTAGLAVTGGGPGGTGGSSGSTGSAPTAGPGGGGGGSGEYGTCVDTETEVFTRRGWLRWDEVQIGDKTLGYEGWLTIQAIHVHEGAHEVIEFSGAISVVATLDHRWRLRDGYKLTRDLLPDDEVPLNDGTFVRVGDLEQHAYLLEGIVWCPEAQHGSWLARRHGTVYFTGNKPGGGSGYAGQVRLTYSNGTPTVGFSVNFGSSFSDQFGNTIAAGLTNTATIESATTFASAITATGGTSASPTVITTDTWNHVSGATNWGGSGNGVNGFFYRLCPDNAVEMAFDMKYTGSSLTNGGSSTMISAGGLPSGYQPSYSINLQQCAIYGNSTNSPCVYVNVGTTGNVVVWVEGGGTFATNASIAGVFRYPLGTI